MRDNYRIIYGPVISEKSSLGTDMSDSDSDSDASAEDKKKRKNVANRRTFEVAMDANKIEIRKALESAFSIEKNKIKKITTQIVPGKPKRKGRTSGFTREWKKAVVTLVPDYTIRDLD
ncbi:MAG: 50S ribosomal protein L23 [Deltaproteobacteria bacterium]|jgi:large subunit ribosomal protein L23|nr:50S ribosomal protein L23 [Deltaproteobacteria bacterium]